MKTGDTNPVESSLRSYMNIEVTREEARLLLSAINMFNDEISEQYAWSGSSQEMKMMCLLDKFSSNLRDLLAQQP